MKKILLVIVCLGVLGCTTVQKQYQSHMDLEYGMTKKEVMDVLGPPSKRQLYKKHNDVLVDYLFYPKFISYEDETPLCFINNKLVGWGKTFRKDHLSDDDVRLK